MCETVSVSVNVCMSICFVPFSTPLLPILQPLSIHIMVESIVIYIFNRFFPRQYMLKLFSYGLSCRF